MIETGEGTAIPEEEVHFHFIRASGPGGQKVNKASTAVQLRFDVANSPSLSEELRSRLMRLAGRRLSREGVLVIEASRFRSQERNRQDALDRLAGLLRRAARRPKRRRPTRPTAAAQARRLQEKRRRGERKRERRLPEDP
jgi:ribosome-associated protein